MRRQFILRSLSASRSGIALLVLLLLLTCRKWDNPFDPINITNRPPFQPSSPFPESAATRIDTAVVLRWTGGDPDTLDTVTYAVFLGTTTNPPLVESSLTVTEYQAHRLNTTTLYYWRVRARDRHGATALSPLWSFTTGAANNPPEVPHDPIPESAAVDLWRRYTLRWTSADPDVGDTVFYDVHLGITSPPAQVSQRQRTNSYVATGLLYDTIYYWRVVAYDQRGATRTGPIWRFRTCRPLHITAPTDTTRWPVNSEQTVLWTGGPLTPPPDSQVIYHSPNDGTNWYRHGRVTTSGRYDWRVPGPVGNQSRVQVRLFLANDTGLATSSRYVVLDTAPPSPITVTSPTGTDRWIIGSVHDITWTGGTIVGMDSTVIFYSTNAGLNWTRQGMTTSPGRFSWTVPPPPTATAKILVRAFYLSRYTDGLSPVFSVIEPPFPDTVIATVTVGAKPRALVWDSLDDRIYVANYTDSSLTVIDGTSNQVLRTIPAGQFPYVLCYNPSANRIYCANYGSNTITVVDAASYDVIATIPVGRNPSALCFNPTSNKVYAVNSRDATVSVIDAANNTVITTVRVDSSPSAAIWKPDINRVYVANFASNSVSVIDGSTDSVIARVAVGYSPMALAEDANGNITVANRNAGTVSVINPATNTVIRTINVETEPWALCANPDSQRLFVCNSAANRVSVINTQNYNLLQGVAVGAHPRAVFWAAWVNRTYVANYDGRSVTILHGVTGNSLKTLTVGNRPTALCGNRTNNKIYVANYDDGTVSVIGALTR